MNSEIKIHRLKGKVQHYAWGGFEYIPELLQIDNPNHKPFAEYWMGSHPGAPSTIVVGNQEVLLPKQIADDPVTYVGQKVFDEFGGLPYLFKVLDVHEMLSIQVHPTRHEAEKGFDAEESSGVAIDAPNRNYKDRNHKPEVMVALSDFWLLHGFKPVDELTTVLETVPEFNFLVPVFAGGNYFELYKKVMELPTNEADSILKPLVDRALSITDAVPTQPEYWVQKLFDNQKPDANLDRGIFSIYFFNIVQLAPGEAIFQGAGIPHAYLFGQNIELMANSDNVLRGGLTPKHIDVPELLKHTHFAAVGPQVMRGIKIANGELNYPCPVPDFGISAVSLSEEQEYSATSHSAEIFIVSEGEVSDQQTGESYRRGDTFFVPANLGYTIKAAAATTLYKAFVP